MSPPCGWCGLKWIDSLAESSAVIVTTLRVVWIEILSCRITSNCTFVTTLRVVWIEIPDTDYVYIRTSHHLAGGVD